MSRHRLLATLLLLGSSFVLVSPVQSQDVTVGIRNGMVRSTVQGSLFYPSLEFEGVQTQKEAQTGLQITGFAALPLNSWFALQMELQYAQKGAAIRGERSSESCGGPLVDCIRPSLDGTYRMTYVQMPLLLRGQMPLGHGMALRALVGPSLDLLSKTRMVTSLDPSVLPANALPPKAQSTFGVVVGIEGQYDLPMAGSLLVGTRYHPGVTRISVIGEDATLRSQAYVVSIGYAFQL